MPSLKPTVGRIVHLYDSKLEGKVCHPAYPDVDLNDQGAGPYPAMILQVEPEGDHVNLLVHAWGGVWREHSVRQKHPESGDVGPRYWVWPPLV